MVVYLSPPPGREGAPWAVWGPPQDTPETRSHTPSRQASSTLSLTPSASWLAHSPAVFTFHLVHTKMFLSPAILTREQVLRAFRGLCFPGWVLCLRGRQPSSLCRVGCSPHFQGSSAQRLPGPCAPTGLAAAGVGAAPVDSLLDPGGAHVASCHSSCRRPPPTLERLASLL